MQWNAEGVIRKKTELEHILKKENIDICCIQETHLPKDKRFRDINVSVLIEKATKEWLRF